MVAHPSAMTASELEALDRDRIAGVDLVITSYGIAAARCPGWPCDAWRLAILDEAQAIKNPGARQTRAVKQLKARARIALTGTPVENRLGDLWSHLRLPQPRPAWAPAKGSTASSNAWLAATARPATRPLRRLVRPYILRRLKTDKSVIADLPDKTEMKAFCRLCRARRPRSTSRRSRSWRRRSDEADGIQREALVLAYLMRFKQICNHPVQWLGDGAWSAADSGKFARLREICRGRSPRAGEGARLHPVPRDDRAAGRRSSARSSGAPAWCCTAARRWASGRSWSAASRRTSARPSSSSRSRPAAPGST